MGSREENHKISRSQFSSSIENETDGFSRRKGCKTGDKSGQQIQEIKKNPNGIKWHYLRQQIMKKERGAEELVLHMTRIPRYLQSSKKENNLKEKALNVGVLQWRKLEMWKDRQDEFRGGPDLHSLFTYEKTSSKTRTVSNSCSSNCKNTGKLKKKNDDCDFKDELEKKLAGKMQENLEANCLPEKRIKSQPISSTIKNRTELNFEEEQFEDFPIIPHSCPLPLKAESSSRGSTEFRMSEKIGNSFDGRRSLDSKRFSSLFNPILPFSSSVQLDFAKSGESHCLDNFKTNADDRSWRTMLNSLIKSRTAAPLKTCKSTSERSNPSTYREQKRNWTLSSSDSINLQGSIHKGKFRTSSKHSVVHLYIVKGLPLFMFSFNEGRDFLAATISKVPFSGKDDFEWGYTVHSLEKGKNNRGRWINPRKRQDGHAFVSNVVGLIKIADTSERYNKNKNAEIMSREFVLYDGELKENPDKKSPKFLPNREQSAIVVSIPIQKKKAGDKFKTVHLTRSSNSSKDRRSNIIGVRDVESSTIAAILPAKIHSLPSEGLPSSLIHRWRTGGSCDCGGWDIGCSLTVLSNQQQEKENNVYSDQDHHLDLFFESTEGRNRGFRMVAIEQGIFSVDFEESISSLQAFSICLAILHAGIVSYLPKLQHLCKRKTSNAEHVIDYRILNDQARLIPYPPHSPVGRL